MLSALRPQGILIICIYLASITILTTVLFLTSVAVSGRSEPESPQVQTQQNSFWYEDPTRYEQEEFFHMCYIDMVTFEGYHPDRAADFCNQMWWDSR